MVFKLKSAAKLPVDIGDLIVIPDLKSDNRKGFIVTKFVPMNGVEKDIIAYGYCVNDLDKVPQYIFSLSYYEPYMKGDVIRHFRNNKQIFV